MLYYCMLLFFVKQKTAYEMRISDWSSDVCSSDLLYKASGLRIDNQDSAGALSRARSDVDAAEKAFRSLAVPGNTFRSPADGECLGRDGSRRRLGGRVDDSSGGIEDMDGQDGAVGLPRPLEQRVGIAHRREGQADLGRGFEGRRRQVRQHDEAL